MSTDPLPSSSPDASGVRRRDLVAGAAGVVVVGVSRAAGEDSRGRDAIGVQGGASGLQLIGRIDQVGNALTGYGYFTRLEGLSLDQTYFIGGVRDQSTARFTFFSTATVASIQTLDTLIVAIASGRVDFFLRPMAGASFDQPSSFAVGERIAADDASLQNVLNVTSPGIGVSTVFADLRRTAVQDFFLDGTRYHLGRVGLRSRLVAPGKSHRIEPVAPTSMEIVAGNITNPDS